MLKTCHALYVYQIWVLITQAVNGARTHTQTHMQIHRHSWSPYPCTASLPPARIKLQNAKYASMT